MGPTGQMQRMVDRKHNQAVTLVEMLVVLGVIMVLAGIVLTATLRVDNQAKERALANVFALLNSALREYYEAADTFPAQPERNAANALVHVELMMLAVRDVPACREVLDKLSGTTVKSQAGAVDVVEPRDPWGTVLDYIYLPGTNNRDGDNFPELISAGPDKQFGTADDISSKGKRQG